MSGLVQQTNKVEVAMFRHPSAVGSVFAGPMAGPILKGSEPRQARRGRYYGWVLRCCRPLYAAGERRTDGQVCSPGACLLASQEHQHGDGAQSPPPLMFALDGRSPYRGSDGPRLPGADLQLGTSHPSDARQINWPVSPGLLLDGGLLGLSFKNDPVLARLAPPLALFCDSGTHNALAHGHGHLSLAQNATLASQSLHAHVSGLARRATGGKGALVGGSARGVLGLPVGRVGTRGGEDVGLGDEALEGQVVGQKSGAVFRLVLVNWCFLRADWGLCRWLAVVGRPRRLAEDRQQCRAINPAAAGEGHKSQSYEICFELPLAHSRCDGGGCR